MHKEYKRLHALVPIRWPVQYIYGPHWITFDDRTQTYIGWVRGSPMVYANSVTGAMNLLDAKERAAGG